MPAAGSCSEEPSLAGRRLVVGAVLPSWRHAEGGIIGAACRAFLVIVLVSAGTSKLAQRDRFLRALSGLRWLPLDAARKASIAVPVVEIALGGALVFAPRPAGYAVLAVLAAFTLVVARELAFGEAFRCGCFGGAGVRVAGGDTLARNAVLLGAAGAVLLDPSTASFPAMLTGVGVGLLLLLYEVGADTIALARQR